MARHLKDIVETRLAVNIELTGTGHQRSTDCLPAQLKSADLAISEAPHPLETPLAEVRKLLKTLPGYRPGGRIGKKLLEAIWRAWNEEYEDGD